MKRKNKPVPRFSELPPRYKFFLSPCSEYRFTGCPMCGRPTKWRKSPLMIHIDPMMLIVLTMHCRFCPDCDLLIAHQDELEAQLAAHMSERDPSVIGNKHIVIGTMERPAWREGMRQPKQLAEMPKYTADFKEELNFTVRQYLKYLQLGEKGVLERLDKHTWLAWRRSTLLAQMKKSRPI